jgi:hypothetical protein
LALHDNASGDCRGDGRARFGGDERPTNLGIADGDRLACWKEDEHPNADSAQKFDFLGYSFKPQGRGTGRGDRPWLKHRSCLRTSASLLPVIVVW